VLSRNHYIKLGFGEKSFCCSNRRRVRHISSTVNLVERILSMPAVRMVGPSARIIAAFAFLVEVTHLMGQSFIHFFKNIPKSLVWVEGYGLGSGFRFRVWV